MLATRWRSEYRMLNHVFPPAGEAAARRYAGRCNTTGRLMGGDTHTLQRFQLGRITETQGLLRHARRCPQQPKAAGMIKAHHARGMHAPVRRHGQNGTRFNHQIAHCQNQAAGIDHHAGAFALRAQGIGATRARYRLDTEFYDAVRQIIAAARARVRRIDRAPRGQRHTEKGRRPQRRTHLSAS